MLDTRGDDVLPFLHVGKGGPDYGVVVALAAAAGEDDLSGFSSDEGSNLFPGVVDRLPGTLTVDIVRRRVAEMRFQVRKHRLRHYVVDRGGSVEVKVYGSVHVISSQEPCSKSFIPRKGPCQV